MYNDVFYSPGAFGDTIYAIPFCLSCVGTYQYKDIAKNQFTYLMDLCCCHKPNGDRKLAYENLCKLSQLIKIQPYIKKLICQPRIPFGNYGALDLGIIRKGRVNMNNGDISLRYRFLRRQFEYYSLEQPWLVVPETQKFNDLKDKIIVFRTSRYRNVKVSYRHLNKYISKIIFVGTQSEYNSFCLQNNFRPLFVRLNSFIELCQMMKACAFVVGNQTFFFALAQALKVPRLVQMSSTIPDVITHGKNGNDFVDNQDFICLLDMYYKKFIQV